MPNSDNLQGLFIANSLLETQIDGAWHELPGANATTASGSEATENTVEWYRGVTRATGQPVPPSIDITLPIFLPHHRVYVHLSENTGRQLPFRLTTQGGELFGATSRDTATIATSGVVTFSGDSATGGNRTDYKSSLSPGSIIQIGGTKYIIDVVSDTGQTTVHPAPGSDVSASQYSIQIASVRANWIGSVRGTGNWSAEGGTTLSSNLSITATSAPVWSVV